MSDIKYIIAGDDNGREHTRFPCLGVVRYAAATVVTVLALAVIAMVIHAVLRSEDIRLFVNDGFIGADNLYSQTIGFGASSSSIAVNGRPGKPQSLGPPRHVGGGKLGDPESTTTTSSSVNPVIGGGASLDDAPTEGASTDQVDHQPRSYGNNGATNVTLQRANMTNLRVILIANNPGGRTKINCTDTTVTLTDTTRYEIGTLKLDPFTVPPQTTITLQKRLKINNSTTLSHIWEHYGGADSFGVTVRVRSNVTSYPLGKAQTKRQTYVCQLVTVGLLDDEWLLATNDVECQLCSKLLDNTATSACTVPV